MVCNRIGHRSEHENYIDRPAGDELSAHKHQQQSNTSKPVKSQRIRDNCNKSFHCPFKLADHRNGEHCGNCLFVNDKCDRSFQIARKGLTIVHKLHDIM